MDGRVGGYLAVVLISSATAFAQPVIRSQNPVLNSASYRTPGTPGSGIAQGSIFTIFGSGLGPTSWVTNAPAFPLLTQLGGSSVKVTVAGVSTDAILLFAYDTQINAILPSNTPVGDGTVVVTYNSRTSAPAPIHVVASAFGIYAFNSMGSGQASATDVNYGKNTIIHTLHPGDYGILWGTGLGAITASDAAAPPVGDLPGITKVYVGNTSAAVNYHGRSGCCAGEDQIVFQVPQGVQGCHVPVAVETAGGVSNIMTIAVSASGQTCSDSLMGQELVDKLASGQSVRFGYIRLESLVAPFISGSSAAANSDQGYATFSQYTAQTAGWAQYGVSPGYCIASDGATLPPADGSPRQLDAGALSIAGATSATLPHVYTGYYSGVLNNSVTGSRFLWSGFKYTAAAAGGPGIGAFSTDIESSIAGVQFTGMRWGDTVPLSGDLTVQWTGGDAKLQNGNVTIAGYSGNDDLSQIVFLQCTAPLAAKRFTIPGWVLSTLPRTGSGQSGTITYPQGWLWLGQYNNPVAFQAQGLDKGILTDVFFNGLGVYFR